MIWSRLDHINRGKAKGGHSHKMNRISLWQGKYHPISLQAERGLPRHLPGREMDTHVVSVLKFHSHLQQPLRKKGLVENNKKYRQDLPLFSLPRAVSRLKIFEKRVRGKNMCDRKEYQRYPAGNLSGKWLKPFLDHGNTTWFETVIK